MIGSIRSKYTRYSGYHKKRDNRFEYGVPTKHRQSFLSAIILVSLIAGGALVMTLRNHHRRLSLSAPMNAKSLIQLPHRPPIMGLPERKTRTRIALGGSVIASPSSSSSSWSLVPTSSSSPQFRGARLVSSSSSSLPSLHQSRGMPPSSSSSSSSSSRPRGMMRRHQRFYSSERNSHPVQKTKAVTSEDVVLAGELIAVGTAAITLYMKNEEMKEMQETTNELKEEISRLEKVVEGQSDAMSEAQKDMESKVTLLQKDLSALDESSKGMSEDLDRANNRTDEKFAQFQRLSEAQASAVGAFTHTASKVDELEQDLKKAAESIDTVRKEGRAYASSAAESRRDLLSVVESYAADNRKAVADVMQNIEERLREEREEIQRESQEAEERREAEQAQQRADEIEKENAQKERQHQVILNIIRAEIEEQSKREAVTMTEALRDLKELVEAYESRSLERLEEVYSAMESRWTLAERSREKLREMIYTLREESLSRDNQIAAVSRMNLRNQLDGVQGDILNAMESVRGESKMQAEKTAAIVQSQVEAVGSGLKEMDKNLTAKLDNQSAKMESRVAKSEEQGMKKIQSVDESLRETTSLLEKEIRSSALSIRKEASQKAERIQTEIKRSAQNLQDQIDRSDLKTAETNLKIAELRARQEMDIRRLELELKEAMEPWPRKLMRFVRNSYIGRGVKNGYRWTKSRLWGRRRRGGGGGGGGGSSRQTSISGSGAYESKIAGDDESRTIFPPSQYCRVCGLPSNGAPWPWGEGGLSPAYEICPKCGAESFSGIQQPPSRSGVSADPRSSS